MARRRRRKPLPTEPVELQIEKLSHDGRGIAHREGKTQFVDGALPGETVSARFTECRSNFDELKALDVLVAADDRVEPPCAHADLCGGCSLQHLHPDAQIELKQSVLVEHFAHFGGLDVSQLVEPMRSPDQGYRRKARLGVKYVVKRDEVLVGFREKRNSFITDISGCVVLDERFGSLIPALREVIRSLSVYRALPQIEVAAGDQDAAMVFRHLEPLTPEDEQALISFGETHRIQIYVQPKGPKTVRQIYPADGDARLHYRLEAFDLGLQFHPLDFTQVNAEINERMVSRALEWLDPAPQDRVLDLFCGLGNFTLPLARKAAAVTGVEGDEAMVVRGRENAELNGLGNIQFFGADLQADFTQESWAAEGFDKILIDPPRSGALEVVQYLPAFGAGRIVYVSCNPATLARDAGELVKHGYRVVKAGVMDMFPHTTHVESIALFERAS